VPFFISYPDGGVKTGDYDSITAHFDIMPTILELAGIESVPENIDGSSLASYLLEDDNTMLNQRSTVVTNQRVYHPSNKRPTVVAFQNWRYISENNQEKLYDLNTDFGQQHNVIAKHPQIANKLRADKLAWWQDAQQKGFKDRYIGVGNQAEDPVRLNAMDWMEVPDEQPVPWFIGHQSPAPEWDYVHCLTEEDKYHPLPWYIDVERSGTYAVKAYFHDKPAATPVLKKYCVIDANGKAYRADIYGRASHCVIDIPFDLGKQKITAWFTDDGEQLSKQKAAFYLYMETIE
jgi:arylsulfatase A-like enzyme